MSHYGMPIYKIWKSIKKSCLFLFGTCSIISYFLFIAEEEMSCLATWKEGSRRYMVSLMNHTHVYNDDSRYRCFIYQKIRTPGGGGKGGHRDAAASYKMAQSSYASCLGLWNVDEGDKTFTLKKRESNCNLILILEGFFLSVVLTVHTWADNRSCLK